MPIITAQVWSEWSNLQLSNPNELASVKRICGQVDRSIKTRLKRTLEQQTFSGLIFDAPDTPNILLGRYAPITISGFDCRFNISANGDPTRFDTNTILRMYDDYMLDMEPTDNTLSPGNLTRIGTIWGISYRWRPYQMTPQYDPNRGAVKLTLQGGWPHEDPNDPESPWLGPEDIVEAACITISKVLGVRRYGMQVGSEAWNGYSYNLPGVGMMINGLLGNPDIRGLLEPYVNYADVIG